MKKRILSLLIFLATAAVSFNATAGHGHHNGHHNGHHGHGGHGGYVHARYGPHRPAYYPPPGHASYEVYGGYYYPPSYQGHRHYGGCGHQVAIYGSPYGFGVSVRVNDFHLSIGQGH